MADKINISHSVKETEDKITITFDINKNTIDTGDFSGNIYDVIEKLKEMSKKD